jgi:hypothetical protein
MPVYRIIIDGKETGETVIASNYADAYFDVASALPLTYQTTVKLIPSDQVNSDQGYEIK